MTLRIDAHHHVWDLAVRDQPWITGDARAPLRRNFGIDNLAPQVAAAGVTATIVVQTVAKVGETEELVADLSPRERDAVMGGTAAAVYGLAGRTAADGPVGPDAVAS